MIDAQFAIKSAMEEPSSSSKVTVEYFDPYDVYPLFSSGLLPRLPLRNLHWESHAGPLRSISSLHIDLVRSSHDSAPIAATESASSSAPDLSRVKSTDSGASGDDGFRTQAIGQAIAERPRTVSRSSTSKSAAKGRRHQIPGLRQTPYLKIFFLRCDDNDTYKSQGRKQVREWIKEHTPTATSTSKATSQENHDNFEWLIVHVIVPNTAAATQPRTSGKSAESSSGSTSEKSGVRWRGGGSSTILEKLRADFNGSSKSGVDRIAQIRIGINDVPYDMLPRVVPAIPGSYTETPQENENAWIDLISKLKFLILQSFDMRVSQYEEDIRKSDSKRSMPGWNFCTFFVLKEGLARGFESVGLVEDALVGYDELAIGLDTIVGEQAASGSGAEHGGSFLPYTEDLKRRAEQARAAILKEMGVDNDDTDSEEPIDLQSTGESTDKEEDEIPINSAKKRYRELILSNDVSIFDFRCYIFSRQLFLLLRQANAWSTQAELLAKLKEQRESSLLGVAARIPAAQPSDDAEDLALLGEVCKRSMEFAASISSIMREDIWSAYFHSQKDISYEKMKSDIKADPLMAQVIENVVSSFTFSLSQQILAQTSTKALPIPASTLAPPTGSGQEQKAAIPEPKTMMHPARSTSLALRSSSREPPSPGLFPRGRRSSLPGPEPAQSTFLKNGLEELAAHRAGLYLLARSVLEHVGKRRGWSTGWEDTKSEHKGDGDLEDVALDDDMPSAEEETAKASQIPPSIHGLDSKLLRTALNDKDNFYRLYETLTDKALRHYTVANRVQSVQTCMADLAILKYHLKDFAGAASYFYRITPFYGDASWTHIEMSMLIMYANCLKELDRKDEYAKVVLKLLARAATIEKDRLSRKSSFKIGPNRSFDWDEIVLDDTYLDGLLDITKALPRDIHVPLQDYFSQLEVNDTLQYHESKDSFGLQLRLHYLLKNDLKIDKAKVRMAPLVGIPGREIWLEGGEEILLKKGWNKLHVHTNVTIPGSYQVTHVILHSSKLVFEYPHDSFRHSSTSGDSFFKCPKLLVYHRAEAFNARLFASKCMHLDRNRSLEIELSSGWNKVNVGQLHVRAATAGLRLQTSEAKVIDGEVDIPKKAEAGVVHFGAMEPESTVRLSIPFNLEHEVNDITLKLELSYTTDQGDFFFAAPSTVGILLPLGVNVQDVFKHTALFSKFTISTSTNIPLRLLSSKLERSEVFEAQSGPGITKPVTIFLRQPATMLYKITKASSPLSSTTRRKSQKSSKTSLSLVLNYMCLDEEVNDAVAQTLEQFLKDNILRPYTRLIIPTVLAELRTHFLPYDFERAAVLGEIPTSFILNIKWRDNFSGLGNSIEQERDTAVVIEQSLREWQQKTPSISLPTLSIDADAISRSRSIVIPVDVPSVNVVHTADLRLLQRASVSTSSAVAAANEPIPVSLHLKSTRAWDTETSLLDNQAEDLEFMYEVSGHSDTWLIGGRRKGHFKVPGSIEGKGKKLTFPVVLIPLREGFLPFPTIEIKPSPVVKNVRPGSPGGDESNRAKPRLLTCETDCKNMGETIRVISDARKTTVSLDASGPTGGAWLLESERRSAGPGGIVID